MTFGEYYQYYLTLHQNKWNRRLHVLGQIETIVFVLFCIQKAMWPLLVFAPFIVYPFAWGGHFFFEKNKPAAWSRPIWAKACDWLMMRDMILGKIKW